MPRLLPGALPCLALAAGCASSPPESAPQELTSVAMPSPAERRAEVADAAIQRIEAGDLDEARNLLDDLVLSEHLARAHAELAAGAPEDALIEVDRALELAPEDPSIRLLKADASLRLAEAKIAAGGGSAGLIEGALYDALDYYQQAGDSAHARFGASRAAWLLGRRDEALKHARAGVTLLASESEESARGELSLSPHRIYAELVFDAYASARGEGREDARALALESEDALARLLGRESTVPWAWQRLSDVHEWEGRPADARGACERGLARAPEDLALLERLARVTTNAEGPAATVSLFEAYTAAHPSIAAGRWHLLVARFQLALAGLKQDPRVLDPAAYAALEHEFRALGESAGELAGGARGYEVVCRLARGWCALYAGDLEAAARGFLSMNELYERGVEWALPGQLESGIQGLFLVADGYNAKEQKLAAGETFEALHALQPDQYLWANNAGFFLRDAAYDLELEGKRLGRAARGSLTNAEALAELRTLAAVSAAAGSEAERGAFRAAADERFARARAIMERSWEAYRAAAALAPTDIRVVNDAALVLVYYLHHDLEWAEQALRRCIELGGPQLEAKKAALAVEESPERASALDAELAQLTEAYGDAHQNLGVLEWVHHKNGPAAIPWLEKSIEIWPTTRQPVTNSLLPQIRGELQPEEDDRWDLLNWAKPSR